MTSLNLFAPFSRPLALGTPAPAFSMLDQTGRLVRSSDLTGKTPFVLVFYPADFSMVCTSQLCALRDNYERLQAKGIEIFGVNPFAWETHRKFAEKNSFPFRILFDPHCAHATLYHAVLVPHFINKRLVYGVDQSGNICFAQGGKPPVDNILAAFSSN